MRTFVKKQWLVIAGLVIGAIAGYGYWKFIGCNSGRCAITSNPLHSTIYGAVAGVLVFTIFQKDKNGNRSQ